MTTLTVTATQQGGAAANGMMLHVYVLTGAAAVAGQTGNSANNQVVNGTAYTASLTNSANSAAYHASSRSPSTATASGTSMTLVDDISDGTNNERYTTAHILGLSSGTTTRGITASATSTGPFALLEILAAATIAEDGSGPAVVSTTAATTVTTASFTPPGGSLLVALISTNGSTGVLTMSVTDNLGSHLNWTEKVKNNPSNGDYAGIWIADVPSAGGGTPQAKPGQTWTRYFHHPQQLPTQPTPAGVSPFPWQELTRRQAFPRSLIMRGRRFEVVPPQDYVFPVIGQRRETWPKAFLVRGKRFETTPPQFNPPYPFTVPVHRPHPRGLPARGRRFEVIPAQVFAPPAYPYTEIFRRQAWPRSLLVRGHRFEVIPAQLNPPFLFPVIVPRRPYPRSLLARGHRFEVVPPQDYVFTVIVPRRPYPRSLLARGKRFETIPPQFNPPYLFVVIRQWRGPRGWPTVRGHRFDPGWGQAAAAPPPPWVWQSVLRFRTLFRPPHGHTVEPPWGQAVAPPPIPPSGIPGDQMTNSGGFIYAWVWDKKLGWMKVRRPPV